MKLQEGEVATGNEALHHAFFTEGRTREEATAMMAQVRGEISDRVRSTVKGLFFKPPTHPWTKCCGLRIRVKRQNRHR